MYGRVDQGKDRERNSNGLHIANEREEENELWVDEQVKAYGRRTSVTPKRKPTHYVQRHADNSGSNSDASVGMKQSSSTNRLKAISGMGQAKKRERVTSSSGTKVWNCKLRHLHVFGFAKTLLERSSRSQQLASERELGVTGRFAHMYGINR